MIELHENTWAARTYRFALSVTAQFWGSRPDYQETNLCQFVRVVFVWLPVAVISNLAALASIVFVLVYLPSIVFGWDYLTFWLLSIAMLIGCGLLLLLGKGLQKLEPTAERLAKTKPMRKVGYEVNLFFALIGRWLHDAHDHICTPIVMRKP